MAVKIRLRRTGRKKQPSYRLVVADTASPRDGQYLDSVGTYNPLTKPADLRIDLEKVEKWLAEGAGMSETAASLIRKARRGGDDKVAVRGVGPDVRAEPVEVAAAAEPAKPPRPGSRGAPKAAAPAAEAAAPVAEATAPAAEAAAPAAEAADAPPVADAAADEAAPAVEAAAAGEAVPAQEPTGDEADAKPTTGSAE
jgi:small subunit ribosomal protein S16